MYFTKEEFINDQRIIAKYFSNAIKTNRIPQAILLYGELNSPLVEVGKYIAQSISCLDGPLGCNNCESCNRFLNGTHPDFIFLDGKDNPIKKEDILQLEDFYSLPNLAKGHKSVYIINLIENTSVEAINALLKFLEEPNSDVIAILTTNNRSKVLPTIISRCQLFHVESKNMNDVLSSYQGEISLDRYYILSKLIYSEKEKEDLNSSKEFDIAFNGASKYIEALKLNFKESTLILFKDYYDVVTQASKRGNFNKNKCYNYFCNIIYIIFNDIVTKNTNSVFSSFIEELQKYKLNIIKASEYIQDISTKLSSNLSFCFVLAYFGKIMEE